MKTHLQGIGERTAIYTKKLKEGDVITFNTCCNANRETYTGVVKYNKYKELVVVSSGKQYNIRTLINIKSITI